MEETSVDDMVHLEIVFQHYVSLASKYLQEWRLLNLLWEFSVTPTKKKMFPGIQKEPAMIQYVPIASSPVTGCQ